MPMQSGKSGLAAKYGSKLNGAVAAHANDETTYGIVRLPGGINGGIAELTKCGFEQYKAGSKMKRADGSSAVGEWYFRAEGMVRTPDEVIDNGKPVPVAGLTTSVMEPLCDTKDSKGQVTEVDGHLDVILNYLRQLGGPEFTDGAETIEEIEALAQELQDQVKDTEDPRPIYFRFSTKQSQATKQYPNPRVWESWHGSKGIPEGWTPEQPPAEQDDSPPVKKPATKTTTPASQQTNGRAANGTGKASQSPTKATEPVKPGNRLLPGKKAPTPPQEDLEFGDIDSLVAAAEKDNQNAKDELTDQALTVGVTQHEIDEVAKNWQQVADWIQGSTDGREEVDTSNVEPLDGDQGEPPPEPEPELGLVVGFHPINPRTNKPSARPVECEVIGVNTQKKTVTLKNSGQPKLQYPNIAWVDLIPLDGVKE